MTNMSNDDTRRFHRLRSALGTTRQLAGTWAKAKTHALQSRMETPDSWIAGGGTEDSTRWQQRTAQRDQLAEYHKVRQDGGVVATLLEARALMVFGPGGEFQSEDDDVAAWLNDTWGDRDNTLLDIGTDAYFYGYSLGEWRETNAGDFAELTLIEPHTTTPSLNRKGEIEAWEQRIETSGGNTFEQTFDADDIMHFKTMKSSGRDPVGMSLLGRAMDEAQSYHDHQAAIDNAIQMQGFPKFHVKLGREDGAVIDDNELRRARPRFDNINELTKWITGQDVDIDIIEAENFEFEGITEHDLSKLAIAFMLPIELTQIGGGDGLGTGFPAKLRRQLFLLGARAHQRLLGDQLVQQVGRPMLERYAADDPDAPDVDPDDVNLEFAFNDPITDIEELEKKIRAIGEDMTVNERRKEFGLGPTEDDDIGEQYEPAASEFDAPSEDPFMADRHDLATDGDFWWEDWFAAAEEQMVWADDTGHALFGFSDGETPAFVKAQLFEAVLEGSPIFSDIESIPDSELMDFRTYMADALTDDGWTITEMRDEIADRFGVDPERAETMARSTTQNMVSEAAAEGYRQREDFDELRFRWPEINDGRDSEVCQDIVAAVPDGGLPLDELKETIHDVADEHDLDPRGWTPHPNCRRRPMRVT